MSRPPLSRAHPNVTSMPVGQEITAETWRRCLREHAEQRRLAPPGECRLCDNAHRNAERERVKNEAVVNVQEAML